jgi:hypothetical protein
MVEIAVIALLLAPFVFGYLLARCGRMRRAVDAELSRVRDERLLLEKELIQTKAQVEAAVHRMHLAEKEAHRLAPFAKVADADAEVRRLFDHVKLTSDAHLSSAKREAAAVLAVAQEKASEALLLVGRERELSAIITALENRIKGYDDSYIQPAAMLLEGLAASYGSEEAAVELKGARALTRSILRAGQAALCDYVEANRRETAIRFVAEAFNGAVDSVLARVKAENAGKLFQEIDDAAALVGLHGKAFRNARVAPEYLAARKAELQAAARFQAFLKKEHEEQRAIRERIREEARAQRDFELAQRTAAREEEKVRKALAEAERRFEGAVAADRARMEVQLEALRDALAQAEAKSVRVLSMAQQTRAGHCYVISNEGSFGADVLKIGMTRRLDPLDRVRELGDASVPFEFDVHAMIYSDDAPTMEKVLHREFNAQRVNMVNPRKEFFRVGLAAVREKLTAIGVDAEFTITAAAREYRETQALQNASAEERRAALNAVLSAEERLEEESEDIAEAISSDSSAAAVTEAAVTDRA